MKTQIKEQIDSAVDKLTALCETGRQQVKEMLYQFNDVKVLAEPEIKLGVWYETSVGDRLFCYFWSDKSYIAICRSGKVHAWNHKTKRHLKNCYHWIKEIK